eukprot:Pgem_evm1s3384
MTRNISDMKRFNPKKFDMSRGLSKCFLLEDGNIAKVVCVLPTTMSAKLFVPFHSLLKNNHLDDVQSHYDLNRNEYIETDM